MNDFIEKNKGPLTAMGSAAAGLVVLIIISAWVNMPSDINVGQILVNVIWLIFLGLLLVAGFLYARERFDGEFFLTEEDAFLEEEVAVERVLGSPSAELTNHRMPELADEKKKNKSSVRHN